MKKKIIALVGIILLIAAICAVIVIKHSVSPNEGNIQTYESLEEANNAAAFKFEHSDRLCGYPSTGYEANSSTIEVQFGGAGYIRKTLGVTDNSDSKSNFPESSEQEVNGVKVAMNGKDGKIYVATWNQNNFAYTICINESEEGVSAEEMIEYIEATR